jgi:hypothetical protein
VATRPDAAWIERIKGWLSLAGVVAVVFYAVLRMAYVQFYLPFGLRPEDVGLGKTELLTQALVGPAIFFLTFGLAALLTLLVGAAYFVSTTLYMQGITRTVIWIFQLIKKDVSTITIGSIELKEILRRRSVNQVWRFVRRWFAHIVIVVSVLSFAWTSYELFENAKRAGKDAHAGIGVNNVDISLLAPLEIPLLEVRAAPTVHWKGSDPPPYVERGPQECLIYLGQSGDKVVLFNLWDNSAVRLSSEDAVLAIAVSGEASDACNI